VALNYGCYKLSEIEVDIETIRRQSNLKSLIANYALSLRNIISSVLDEYVSQHQKVTSRQSTASVANQIMFNMTA